MPSLASISGSAWPATLSKLQPAGRIGRHSRESSVFSAGCVKVQSMRAVRPCRYPSVACSPRESATPIKKLFVSDSAAGSGAGNAPSSVTVTETVYVWPAPACAAVGDQVKTPVAASIAMPSASEASSRE